MRYLVSAMLVVVAIIHLLPLPGLLGNQRLGKLYGVSIDEPNLSILMRHRAILLGLLGIFLLIAAFRQAWQVPAFIAGAVSIVSFMLLAKSIGGYNAQIARVVAADQIAAICLIVGIVAYAYSRLAA